MTVRRCLTISGLSSLFGGDLSAVVAAAEAAETAGFHRVIVTDHVAIGADTSGYPYGRFPFEPDEPWPEPLTLLTAIAARTATIRLATGVLIAPLRPAVLLAKQAATLDVLSGGRLDLGVGSGWQRAEHEAVGAAMAGRTQRMTDTVEACQALWAGGPASFRSDTATFDDLWCEPHPVQPGGVPIWFGGGASAANCERVARLGSGWMPLLGGEALARGVIAMRSAFDAAGRDPASLQVLALAPTVSHPDGTPDPAASVDAAEALGDVGVTDATFTLSRWARFVDEIPDVLAALV